ncbi:hypothetical protein NE237_018598 [Protea cynaroides]|uniref:FAF domain-containing protein n=1 Tax=Protea cynaroides TaxID=273540 RepID=A0A9Q0QPB8_9MAGN|nr:hypothetical protein NE237_018598 [Protea cynaroides]
MDLLLILESMAARNRTWFFLSVLFLCFFLKTCPCIGGDTLSVGESISRDQTIVFPPPISCIGRSGKPWFASDPTVERFILKEIRIPTQESLRSCWEDGRLKLRFVQPDGEIPELSVSGTERYHNRQIIDTRLDDHPAVSASSPMRVRIGDDSDSIKTSSQHTGSAAPPTTPLVNAEPLLAVAIARSGGVTTSAVP